MECFNYFIFSFTCVHEGAPMPFFSCHPPSPWAPLFRLTTFVAPDMQPQSRNRAWVGSKTWLPRRSFLQFFILFSFFIFLYFCRLPRYVGRWKTLYTRAFQSHRGQSIHTYTRLRLRTSSFFSLSLSLSQPQNSRLTIGEDHQREEHLVRQKPLN